MKSRRSSSFSGQRRAGPGTRSWAAFSVAIGQFEEVLNALGGRGPRSDTTWIEDKLDALLGLLETYYQRDGEHVPGEDLSVMAVLARELIAAMVTGYRMRGYALGRCGVLLIQGIMHRLGDPWDQALNQAVRHCARRSYGCSIHGAKHLPRCRPRSRRRCAGGPLAAHSPGPPSHIRVNRRGLNGVTEHDIASGSWQAAAQRLEELTNLFRQRLIDDVEKRRAFDALYRELAQARALADGQYLMPLVQRLISVIDRVADGPGELAKSVAEELTEILSMYEVVQIKPGSDHFDPRLQEVDTVVEAADADEDGTVASVRRSGWRLGSRILRPVLVDVRRLPHQAPLA